ncbi:DNA cytosine methyltransferase [Actinosynnema mirum]|uniref:DNA (cytosine-5-)-methyltransferase n=1 Tax=Actinosynnema mirum (strain ATCC 29888 / DSM 43827 / JCM 3225 / NBRC 14064 / NCIMB 13271 / NRRL B-12336 / IMRU 3971 / 101) TaxID=446462 RepID=C6WBA1_ACTMD|nr:DNA cytosine methyltransferase [Actinosynnema mirum]ACU39392.1 C-5 cytosine-specific DNA methylase [Actinosynnema mirum DSM 43827]
MLTATDLFCGAGGSGLGATAVPGIQLVMAANHSPRAIETHATNFPHCQHDCADISQVVPRRYRRTNILWASPECTNHTTAKGRKRREHSQEGLFAEPLPDHVAERSRATMWDVIRFAEAHLYDAVIVENVVEAALWAPFQSWLLAMDALGYQHHVVYLNSMHAPAIRAPRAPQSRDRMYVVFWRRGNRTPDLEVRPHGRCSGCDREVECRQVFKRRGTGWPAARWGRYRAQYTYVCATPGCGRPVEPYAMPASAVLDWSVLGQRIGDRARPLSEKTLGRIRAGLARYATAPQLVPSGGTWNETAQPASEPFRARTTRETEGLVVPVEGRVGNAAAPTWQPIRTQTTRHESALVVPYYSTSESAFPADRPLGALTTVDRYGLTTLPDTPADRAMVMRNNSAPSGTGAHLSTPAREPLRTLTTAGHQSLVAWPEAIPAVEDCTFRMLSVQEIQAAMAFRPDYTITGSKREQVHQLGNGVTPPAAEFLFRAVADSLGAN